MALSRATNLGWLQSDPGAKARATPSGWVQQAYSSPPGQSVAFTWDGASAYSAPTGSAVAFTFGAVPHDGNASGATLSDTASLVAGSASASASISGATISDTASLTAGTATATATLALPNADTATGDWTPSTGATLYGCIDEATYDDADYISTTTTAAATMALSTVNDPLSSTGHVIRFRAKSPNSNTLTVTLKQGGTTIKTETTPALTGSFADYSIALSGAEADSITDYSALSITLEAV